MNEPTKFDDEMAGLNAEPPEYEVCEPTPEHPSALIGLLEGAASKEDCSFAAQMILMITEDLMTFDSEQIGKAYKYIRHVRAGLDT